MELIGTVDTALFGRRTYQDFENYRPAVASKPTSAKNELDFSRWIDNTPKAVASRTKKTLDWKNSTLLSDNIEEGVSRLKGLPGNNFDVRQSQPGLTIIYGTLD